MLACHPADLDVRVMLVESPHQRWHQAWRDVAEAAERNPRAQLAGAAEPDRLDLADAADDVSRFEQQMVAGLGEDETARMAPDEQLLAENVLEAGNRARDRRRRGGELDRGAQRTF